MNILTEREILFRNDINEFTEYTKELRDKFFNYWSEPNKSKTKMRWELQRTWEIKRRLKTFFDNQNKWNASNTPKGKAAGAHQLLEELRANFKPE